jgi:hypothetical protein
MVMLPAGIGLLSLFVFICSFIPIAGVFISTTPIAFVALTEYGFMKVRCRPRIQLQLQTRPGYTPALCRNPLSTAHVFC